MKVLVTGAAGFIGFHVCKQLLFDNTEVVGVDSLNDYYSVQLKKDRLALLDLEDKFTFCYGDISDIKFLEEVFKTHQITHVINLAAQAGVRYSLENPLAYVQSNLVGFGNILECCRRYSIEHLVYASSSSVYGMNEKMPFSESDPVDHPVSLYAATKKSNEVMAHSYSHLYNLPATGLRFFTVYGPWGRPDMALFIFTKAILSGEAIPVFNNGELKRDFTYIDDITRGVCDVLVRAARASDNFSAKFPDPSISFAPFAIYNIGNNEPVELKVFIKHLEDAIGVKAIIKNLPMQPGDVKATYANIDALNSLTGFAPKTPLRQGITSFVEWYRSYFKV